jgi:hypothetical protein
VININHPTKLVGLGCDFNKYDYSNQVNTPQITQTFDLYTNYYLYSDHNNNARIANSLLITSTDALTALVNPTDNTPIIGFHLTPEEIGRMQAGTLNAVLRQLGLRLEGHKAIKEQRLRVSIGSRKNPA